MQAIPDTHLQSGCPPCSALQEFCNMEQLHTLLRTWSESTGMSAVILDSTGHHAMENIGMTEFCTMIHNSPRGASLCRATWKEDHEGIFKCEAGFCDFCVPITLPDGRVLGRVIAGQALSTEESTDSIVRLTARLGLKEDDVRRVLSHIRRKTPGEMEASYKLLSTMLHFFVEKSYAAWQARNELQQAPASQDRVLSHIAQILYSCNLTVDLHTGRYTLLPGSGMRRTTEECRRHRYFQELDTFWDTIVHPAYLERFRALIDLSAIKNNPMKTGFLGSLEYPVLYPGEDAYEWHQINVFLDTTDDGERFAHILTRDITQTHNAQEKQEKELRAAAAKNQILSELTQMLYSYNLTLNLRTGKYDLTMSNGMTHFMEIFKSTNDYETAYAKKLTYLSAEHVAPFSALTSLQALRSKSNAHGFIGSLEYSAIFDHTEEWHEVNVFIRSDESGDPVANILGRDVTAAHNQADTRSQLEIANAASAAKTVFLFNMSHDIRTPMNAIIGFTELLDKHLDDPALARTYISKLRTANDFLLSLINNVLEMARIESGKETLDELVWNTRDFIGSLYSMFASQMESKNITFLLSMDVEHENVVCDETKLREIFLNILSNALKYTPAGGTVRMNLQELPSDRPGYAIYQTVVEDTGIGMSEDFLPHLFEEFSRERTSTESRVSGTGLGMPIVRKLVDLMGGTISVESAVGKGTRFTVTLPHRIAQETEIRSHAEVSETQHPACFAGKRILLAEDNALNAEIAITILEEAGFAVEHADDGIPCVDMLEKAPAGYYDLILMDIQMPNMDGYKATQTIRKFADPEKARIPILAMTANAFEEDRRDAFRVGMNGHIAKPINVEELFALLAGVLNGM